MQEMPQNLWTQIYQALQARVQYLDERIKLDSGYKSMWLAERKLAWQAFQDFKATYYTRTV